MSESAKLEKMFEPFKIKNVELRNRLAMAPLKTQFISDSDVTEQLIAYLAERARHGVGLIITFPVCGALIPGSSQPPIISSPLHIRGWNELAETIHAFGAKLFVQVSCGRGRQVPKGTPAKAPSPVPLHISPENLPVKCREFEEKRKLPSVWASIMEGEPPIEMTIEEIETAEDSYAIGARLLKQSGVDGVELHFPHGYLGYSFLSPRTNIRKDQYGGSFENRVRFLTNTMTKVRREVGDSFVVGIRISGDEHMPGGLGFEETSRMLKIAEDKGLDYVHLSDGCFEAAKWYVPDEDGTMLWEAEALKKILKIPVITPSIHDPVAAEKALKEGKTDMVSLGRAILADSAWVEKAKESQANKIVKCIRCLTCLRRVRTGLAIRCEVNPGLGTERYNPDNYRRNAPRQKVIYYPD